MELDSGIVFVLALLVLTFGSVLLAGYAYFLYLFGVRLSHTRLRRLNRFVAMTLIGGLCVLVVTLGVLALPVESFFRIVLAICLVFIHTQPTCVGYYAGVEMRRIEDSKRFAKNVDDWLADWECGSIGTSHDDSGN